MQRNNNNNNDIEHEHDLDEGEAQFTFVVQAQRVAQPYEGPTTRSRARQHPDQDMVHFEIEATLPQTAMNENGTPTDQVMMFLAHLNEIFAASANGEFSGVSRQLAQAVLENRNNILARLFNAVMQGESSLQGQPPASKEAKDALRSVLKIGKKVLARDSRCSICLEDFGEQFIGQQQECEYGDSSDVRIMPCQHVYHQTCIFTWLDQSNYCPQCRYEVMTDNVQYNSLVKERMKDRDLQLQDELKPQKRKLSQQDDIQPARNLRRRRQQK